MTKKTWHTTFVWKLCWIYADSGHYPRMFCGYEMFVCLFFPLKDNRLFYEIFNLEKDFLRLWSYGSGREAVLWSICPWSSPEQEAAVQRTATQSHSQERSPIAPLAIQRSKGSLRLLTRRVAWGCPDCCIRSIWSGPQCNTVEKIACFKESNFFSSMETRCQAFQSS